MNVKIALLFLIVFVAVDSSVTNEIVREGTVSIYYQLASYRQSCDSYCAEHRMACVKTGAFPGGSAEDIFARIGFPCKYSTPYDGRSEQPCYRPGFGFCYGAKDIPNEIDCAAAISSSSVKRLCPCIPS